MADFYLKKGDTLPRLSAVLKGANGLPIDLSAAGGVTFKMRKVGSSTTKVDEDATVTDADGGAVEYAWQAADVDEAGQFDAEWLVDWGGGGQQRVPNYGFFTISILDGIT